MSEPIIRPAGTSTVLRLGGVGSTLVLVLFCATQIVLFSTNPLHNEVLVVIALLLTLAAAVALALPTEPLPVGRSIAIAAVPGVDAVLMSFSLPPTTAVGYAGWHLGASSFLMFFLALRNRPTLAWVGLLTMSAVTIVWTVNIGAGALAGINLVARHLGILLIGTLFNVGFRRTASSIARFNRTEQERAAAESAALARAEARRTQSTELEASARDSLERIASGGLSASERSEYLLLEARLRDSVRARGLHRQPLIDAATEARRRGVEVTLLDDSQQNHDTTLHGQTKEMLVAAIAARLTTVSSGRFVARLLPTGRGTVASIAEDDGVTSLVVYLDASGATSPTPAS